MFRGYPGDVSMDQNSSDSTENHISVFDFHTNKWHRRLLADNGINPSVNAGAACTIIRDKLYIFSGWKIGHLNNDIHELDLETFEWTKLVPLSKEHEPLLKNKCGVVSYGPDMLFIFGGYGYPLIGQPLQEGASYDWERPIMHGTSIGWTNEMHLYHLRKNIWIVPKTTGIRPPPCAAFTLNWIDQFRVLLFGGRQKPERTNEIHILDMFTWVYDVYVGCMYVCTCMYVHVQYVCMCVCMYVCMYVRMYTYVRMYACIYIYVQCTCIYL